MRIRTFLIAAIVACQLPAQAPSANLVPPEAPDSVPDWLSADSSLLKGKYAIGPYTSKYALVVGFSAGTSREAKQAAIDSVGGRVVGGRAPLFYIVQVPSDSTGAKLFAAQRKLRTLPQVQLVTLYQTDGVVPRADLGVDRHVTLVPPDSVPAWVHADSNISERTDSVHVRFVKRILMVRFRATATLAERESAITLVNGIVVGGSRNPDGVSGFYYVQVPDDRTGAQLFAAGRTLASLPQVQSAVPEIILEAR